MRVRAQLYCAALLFIPSLTCAAQGTSAVATMQASQQSLTIEHAVDTAMRNRPELRAATARASASGSMVRQAGLLPNPRLIFQSENIRRDSGFDYSRDADTFVYGSQLLETSGRRGARIGVAKSTAERTRLEEQMTRRDVAFEVKEAYWKALVAQRIGELYRENLDYLDQIVSYHEARLREGKAAEVDVIRIRLEAQRLKAAAENATLEAERGRIDLARAMGVADPQTYRLSSGLNDINAPQIDAANKQDRIESRIASENVEHARRTLSFERATGRPDLDVLFGYKRTSGFNTALAGLQLNVPIFNRNQGAAAAAKATVVAAEEDQKTVQLNLARELELARLDEATRKRQVEGSFRPLRDQAVQISEISRAAYKEGGLDLLRLIDSERLRVESEITLARALGEYHRSVATLEKAEGAMQ